MTKKKTIKSTIIRKFEMSKNIFSNKYAMIKANIIRSLEKIFGKYNTKYALTALVKWDMFIKVVFLQGDG